MNDIEVCPSCYGSGEVRVSSFAMFCVPCWGRGYAPESWARNRAIYNWIAANKIEYKRTPGGSIRIYVDTLWRTASGEPMK